jgi:hypothetical protein
MAAFQVLDLCEVGVPAIDQRAIATKEVVASRAVLP